MILRHVVAVVVALALASGVLGAEAQKHELVKSKDGKAIGYKDTAIQPWSGYHVHDPDRPIPPRVEPAPPTAPTAPPSDATVLFAGKDMDAWQPAKWTLEDGLLVAGEGHLATKQAFGDCQLHLEFLLPEERGTSWGNRGNNGVLLLGLCEVQIYDSLDTQIYPDGQAAAIYSQTPPLVNACRKAGQWETYDIAVTAPVVENGKVVKPMRVTMLHNGVLVHLNQEIYGSSPHGELASYANAKSTGPIALMAHHCPVKFRNIWIRPLDLAVKKASDAK